MSSSFTPWQGCSDVQALLHFVFTPVPTLRDGVLTPSATALLTVALHQFSPFLQCSLDPNREESINPKPHLEDLSLSY